MRLVSLLLVGAFVMVSFPTDASSGPIAPGDSIGNCTLAFVLDDTRSSAVYMLTADHCVSGVGQTIRHYDARSAPVTANGGSITIGTAMAVNPSTLGRVVAVGGYTTANTGDYANDWALIQVNTGVAGRVVAQVQGAPMAWPTGVASHANNLPGDPLHHTGFGLGFSTTEATRENRYGALTFQTSLRYGGYSPIAFGDSGGPAVNVRTGEAVGLITGLGGVVLGADVAGNDYHTGVNTFGASIEGVMNALSARGYALQLRTA